MSRPAAQQPPAEFAALLDELSACLRQARSSELYVLRAKLDGLQHRMGELARGDLRRLELLARPMRPALCSLVEHARRGELDDPIARRDLRTVLRSLRCTADHLDDAELAPLLAVRYARVDVSHLLASCHAAFRKIADERQVTFDMELPGPLFAELDIDKIQRIVVNLLFNALKHTKAPGDVRLWLQPEAGAEEIAICIRDSGPSIAQSRVESLFGRSRPIDRGPPGAHAPGLCLGIARELAVLHGGSLRVQNNDDAGVTFELRLPRQAPSGTRVPRRVSMRDDFAARVVELARGELRAESDLGAQADDLGDDRPLLLIVEDTRSLHRLLADCFRTEYRVASAFDGLEGLGAAETLRPDLILTDLIMPRLDGRSMIRALRMRRELAGTPIVVLTTKENPEQELELLDQGVQDVIHKPFLLPEVKARVRNLVASKRARDVLSDLVDRHQTDLMNLADTVARQQRELQLAFEQVDAARAQAEAASRVKSNFLRMMSHELKTPVTAMHLQLRILERDPQFGADARLQESLARIWRSSRKLLCLVDTMLEWARVESGRCRVYPESFDVRSLVSEVAAELSTQARQKRVELTVHVEADVEPQIVSDRRIVQLVLVNLVARAVQLTRADRIALDVRQRGALRRISVTDPSPLSDEEHRELFEPISATKDLRWTGGTGSGLGLQVVRDIARAVGADIVLEPGCASGTTLTLELPMLKLDAPKLAPAAGSA